MSNSQDPYQPWKIQESDYPKDSSIEDKLKFLLGFAILAPSTFNSQPWKCKVINDGYIILIDNKLVLEKSDKTGRFAYISLGCFIENLIVACSHFGFKTEVEYLSINNRDNSEVYVKLVKKDNIQQSNDDKDLFHSISKRLTNRSAHLNKSIPRSVIRHFEDFSNRNQSIVILDKEAVDTIVKISVLGDHDIWTDDEFRKEHSGWVRHNLTRKPDGMPGFGVGVGLIPSFFAKPIIRSKIFPKIQISKNIKMIKNSENYVILCSDDNFSSWIRIGMLYEKICLYLTSCEISSAPMGQFIESNIARKELRKVVHEWTDLYPQIFFRIGYPSRVIKHSPRKSIDEILIS